MFLKIYNILELKLELGYHLKYRKFICLIKALFFKKYIIYWINIRIRISYKI